MRSLCGNHLFFPLTINMLKIKFLKREGQTAETSFFHSPMTIFFRMYFTA